MTTLSSIRNAAIEDAGAGGSGGLTVYATKEDLPTSGLTEGDQAYVSANRRFYISNGSGWYNVALINATPTLSIDPTGTIALSITGETTTITLTATDSDNAVAGLTYSVESDGSFGGLATISQDSSVFTITPLSEDSATTVQSTLTFKASDGINFGSGDRTLTLSFIPQNSNYTTLLTKADTGGTDNQVDASTNNYTVTENGNVTSTAFTPYHPGGYSTNFGTSNSNILIEDDPAFSYGTGDFTWELWINFSSEAQNEYFIGQHSSTLGLGIYISLSSIRVRANGTAAFLQGPTNIEMNTWYHIALVRESGVLTLYQDGVNVASAAFTNSISTGPTYAISIGEWREISSAHCDAYIKDVRVVTSAVYTADFTPPTEPLTAIANTILLLCHLPYVGDGSSNNWPLNGYINVGTYRRSPLDYLSYDRSTHGGSVYFDGTGDYLSIVDNAMISTGEFTVEGWVYPIGTPGIFATQVLFHWSDISDGNDNDLIFDANGAVTCRVGSGGNTLTSSGNYAWHNNRWHHFAVVRNSSNNVDVYLNGKHIIDHGVRTDDMDNTLEIGRNPFSGGGSYFNGYMSDFRIVESALYTADFTPPTEPLTAVANTKLLTCTNKNDIWDASSGNLLTKVGNATSSDTQRKFTSSSAMYFDGTGDNITISDLAMGSGDCTFEFWMYQNIAQSAAYRCMLAASTYASGIPFTIYTYSSNVQVWLSSSGSAEISGAFTASTWHHIALVRNSGTWTLYIDGTSAGTSTTGGSYDFAATTDWRFGENHSGSYDWQGYIQDPRFTIGLARYTGNFTPPTSEFDG